MIKRNFAIELYMQKILKLHFFHGCIRGSAAQWLAKSLDSGERWLCLYSSLDAVLAA